MHKIKTKEVIFGIILIHTINCSSQIIKNNPYHFTNGSLSIEQDDAIMNFTFKSWEEFTNGTEELALWITETAEKSKQNKNCNMSVNFTMTYTEQTSTFRYQVATDCSCEKIAEETLRLRQFVVTSCQLLKESPPRE